MFLLYPLLLLAGCANPVSDGSGPVTLAAQAGIGRITVTWPAADSTGYVLEWSADAAFPPAATTVVAGAASPFVLDDVDPGARRYFRVAAQLPSGRGAWASVSAQLADSWTWSRIARTENLIVYDQKIYELDDGSTVVFITSYPRTIETIDVLTLTATGVIFEGYARFTDRVDEVSPPRVTREGVTRLRGGPPVAGSVRLAEIDRGTGWVPLDPVKTLAVGSSADRTVLVVDGDYRNPFELVP